MFNKKEMLNKLTNEEKSHLKTLYTDTSNSANDRYLSMSMVIRAILLSPNFVFRPEIDDDLNSSEARVLNNYELASRLSYFLWSSMPDTQLFAKAADGTLSNKDVLKAEADRMLNDPKAEALLENFAPQWLGYQELNHSEPSTELFPSFNDELKNAFVNESKYFMDYVLDNNRPVADLVTADYTFLNGPLANHYGVSNVIGSAMKFHRWDEGSSRRGMLGHASVLTIHSHPEKTSPVKRGVWVMDRLMCDRPPEPTPDTGSIPYTTRRLKPKG